MVMEISFSTMFFHDHPLDLIFDAVERSGAGTLEFWPETPDWWLSGLPKNRLFESLASHQFSSPVSMHSPVLDLNPCSINPDVAEVSIRWIERSILLAEEIGAGVCTIHPGRRTSRRPPTETDYRRLNHMLDSIAPIAEKSKVKVSIENMEPKVNALVCTPAELFLILDERDWISCTLDVCHVSSQGVSVLSEFLDGVGSRLVNIHLSGAAGGTMHLPSYGNPWADEALGAVMNSGYDGLITLEINDLSYTRPLTYEEKISILSQDVEYVQHTWRAGC